MCDQHVKAVFLRTRKKERLSPKVVASYWFKLRVNKTLKCAARQPQEVVYLDDLTSATAATLRTKWLLAVVRRKDLSEQG